MTNAQPTVAPSVVAQEEAKATACTFTFSVKESTGATVLNLDPVSNFAITAGYDALRLSKASQDAIVRDEAKAVVEAVAPRAAIVARELIRGTGALVRSAQNAGDYAKLQAQIKAALRADRIARQ